MGPVDLFATVLALAVLLGCVNHIWGRLPPAIGMLLGSLAVSLLIVASDHVLHLHVMHWFRGTLGAADLPHLFLNGALALLLFAGSLHVDVGELNRRRWVILLLATVGVILSTVVSATACGRSWASAPPCRWSGVSCSAPSSPRPTLSSSRACCAAPACRRACAGQSSAKACSTPAQLSCCFCWRSA